MVESLWLCERRKLERFVSTQPPYSILTREAEREIFPVCQAHGFGAIVWSPLEGGWLAGRYRKGKPVAGGLACAEPHRVRRLRARRAST